MTTTAYISSNEPRKIELEEQIAAARDEITTAREQLARIKAGSAEGRALKRRIADQEERIAELNGQMPALLFSEAGALAELEGDIDAALATWERHKARWLADAATNPAYAVRNARDIITQQTYVEQALLLQDCWRVLSAEEGRSLATFRKAHDQVARARERDMLSKLTAGQSTCAFHNAVEHQQGCALNEYAQYYNHVGDRLAWYEDDARQMPHSD